MLGPRDRDGVRMVADHSHHVVVAWWGTHILYSMTWEQFTRTFGREALLTMLTYQMRRRIDYPPFPLN